MEQCRTPVRRRPSKIGVNQQYTTLVRFAERERKVRRRQGFTLRGLRAAEHDDLDGAIDLRLMQDAREPAVLFDNDGVGVPVRDKPFSDTFIPRRHDVGLLDRQPERGSPSELAGLSGDTRETLPAYLRLGASAAMPLLPDFLNASSIRLSDPLLKKQSHVLFQTSLTISRCRFGAARIRHFRQAVWPSECRIGSDQDGAPVGRCSLEIGHTSARSRSSRACALREGLIRVLTMTLMTRGMPWRAVLLPSPPRGHKRRPYPGYLHSRRYICAFH